MSKTLFFLRCGKHCYLGPMALKIQITGEMCLVLEGALHCSVLKLLSCPFSAIYQGLYSTDFTSSSFKVKFSMKLTYITPDDDLDFMQNEDSPSNGNASRLANINTLWDDDYPWSDWYSAEDPIKGKTLIFFP